MWRSIVDCVLVKVAVQIGAVGAMCPLGRDASCATQGLTLCCVDLQGGAQVILQPHSDPKGSYFRVQGAALFEIIKVRLTVRRGVTGSSTGGGLERKECFKSSRNCWHRVVP